MKPWLWKPPIIHSLFELSPVSMSGFRLRPVTRPGMLTPASSHMVGIQSVCWTKPLILLSPPQGV